MPLQNRVTPAGDIITTSARGDLMGNRGGRFHRPDRMLGPRRWISWRWIACRLAFKHRHREIMAPRGYTELFFLDEATALAAGHRPCFECRRHDANSFARLWTVASGGTGVASADRIDAVLHAERLTPSGTKRTYNAELSDLPTGAFVKLGDASWLVLPGKLVHWSPAGYLRAKRVPAHTQVEVLTPSSVVATFRAGYHPQLHASIGPHL